MLGVGTQLFQARSALSRLTSVRDFLEVIEDPTARLGFKFLFRPTGKVFNSIEEAVNQIEQMGLTDYRSFGVSGKAIQGSTKGATQFAEEARMLNVLLSHDPTLMTDLPRGFDTRRHAQVQETLRRMGLERFIGSEMNVEYIKFDFSGRRTSLAKIWWQFIWFR